MDQDRLEYAEASQGGKRRSSLGALSKSKPVTKLKSMFEAKGPAPKIKESGLLGKLKPISASHDATSFAAALSGSMASLKMSVGGPPQQPPPTPIAPLFSVLPAPVEPDVLPQPSPPRSAEDLQMSLPVYQESLPDGGDVDARKSPGSAGFLKRMSSSLKKALTPKSSTGKQKADGFSPSYAGSDASNLSPRPSAQLLMTPGSQPSSTSMDLNSRSDQTQSAPTRSPSALMGYEVHVARDYPEWTRPCEGGVDSTFRPTSSSSRPPRSPSMAHPPSGSVPDGVSAQHEASPPIASRDVSPRPLPTSSPDQSQTFKCIAQDAGAPMGENENFVNADSKGPAVPPVAQDVVPEDSFAASLTASPTVPDCSDGSHGSPPMREVNMGAATSSSPQLPSSNPRTDACDIVADLQADELVFPSLLSTDQYGPVIHIVEAVASHVSDGLGAQTDESADVDMGACDSGPPIEELQAAVPSSDEMPNAERAAAEIDAPVSLMEVDSAAQQEPVFQQPVPLATRRTFGAAGSLNLDLSGAENNSPGSPDTATPTGAAADNQEDDPMMVSPMPQRWSTVPLVVHVGLGQVMPDMGAPDAAQSTSSLPGDATKISPDTARLGLRAFQLNDIEEPAAIVEARAYGEMAVQEEVTRQGDDWSAETPDALAPLQSISPIIDNMNIGTVTPVTTADGHVDGSAATTTAADVESAVELPTDVSAPDLIASVPSVAAPPPLPVGEDVPVADSLEAIEALWGNDDLLEEPGSATAKGLTPQVASSPVSTSKQAESPFTSQSGRKVGPGVVLQVERESLDLFSLRNSCASRVSDSLMVESLDSFESMGLCAKSRAMGFVPMAPLKEGDEDLAMVGRTNGSDGESGTTSAGPQSPNVTFSVNNGGSPDSQATPGLNAAAATAVVTPSANKPACSSGGRGSTSSAAAGMVKAPGSAAKAATPSVAARPSATPSTALKAMAAANAAGASASKACISKRPLPNPAPQPRQISTPGQQVALPSGPSSGSRLPGFTATPASGTSRTPAPIPGVKPSMPSTSAGSTPGAVPARQGVTPRSGGVFSSGKGQNPISGISRPGLFAHQPAVVGRPGSGLFDTPVIFRAAAVPLADTPFSASDFDLDTVDISAEASKAIALLGGGDASIAGAAAQHATPALAAVRGAVMPGTPTLSVLETHVQLLTNKLAEAEDNINQLQNANAMLRDQLSTLQFKLSMTNDLDMERDAREYLEHELSTLRHQTGGLEADLRAAHAEIKRYEQAAAETLAAQQSKEAEWARKEVELEQRMQQMTSEVEAARSFAQQADARNAEAEARAAAATAKCDEETARGRELQVTLGLQAHQLVQVQRARDDAEAKFQRAMEQLIAAQTSHKKAVVEYEQKLLQSSNLVSQINDVRDKYRQMKQHAANAEQRAQHAEAKAQETANALAKANMEKAELMQMCNELLTQLEATKVKGGR
ncbi:hypothetical protein VaNZ11_005185 [Volvox africanus]|uniref:Transforming acidic coiled-coil-containing protein C-terminal domain-containing protein n=1 Tax=Volvox africanus TaxID=51714 RepID=A0ABQ5RZS2_9CHLO|nr:hypothetical protein VaNZ11_005185 [Volvox africanus]